MDGPRLCVLAHDDERELLASLVGLEAGKSRTESRPVGPIHKHQQRAKWIAAADYRPRIGTKIKSWPRF